jgi:hypothetical protein
MGGKILRGKELYQFLFAIALCRSCEALDRSWSGCTIHTAIFMARKTRR